MSSEKNKLLAPEYAINADFSKSADAADDLAISVQGLSKCYQIYDKPHDRLKQSLYPRLQRLVGKAPVQYHRDFWALRDVSFEVKRGETVGIIGRNGSGKSTLLQLVCGTLAPSSGKIDIQGRVAALLELGAGFNPEFTGRENVYMNAAILGLSKAEIDATYEDILAFADIGEFISQPVKTYSSGMYVRLAFSVAINVNPDILIVDEALAVGDMLFQAKCMIRLKQMMDNGVSVLFVSHDTTTVKGLCKTCVFLEKGRLVEFGKAAGVVDRYISATHLEMNQLLQKSVSAVKNDTADIGGAVANTKITTLEPVTAVSIQTEAIWPSTINRYGDGGARILDIKLLDTTRTAVKQLEVDQGFIIQVSIRFEKDLPTFAVGYSIRDLKGQMLVGAVTTGEHIEMPAVSSGDIYVVDISSKNKMTAGVYTISVGLEFPVVLNQQHIFLDIIEHAVVFQSYFSADPAELFPALVKVPAQFACIKAK